MLFFCDEGPFLSKQAVGLLDLNYSLCCMGTTYGLDSDLLSLIQVL